MGWNWILYDNHWWLAQWLDWEEAPQHFPKLNLHQRRDMVTVWWSAACLIHYSFLNPSKTREACSANQWDALKTATPAASIGQRKGPRSSLWQYWPHVITHNWVRKLCLICYSPDLSPTDHHFFNHLTTFCRENTSTTSRRQKMLSKSSLNPKPWLLTLQE